MGGLLSVQIEKRKLQQTGISPTRLHPHPRPFPPLGGREMFGFGSSDGAFQRDGYEFLRFNGKFHGQFLQHFTDKAVDQQLHSLFTR